MPRLIPRSPSRHPRKSHLRSLARLAGVPRDTVEAVLVTHAALILDDLAAGRPAWLPGLGKIRIRRGPAQRVKRIDPLDRLPTPRDALRPGRLRARLQPSPQLARVLREIDETFE